MAGATAEGIRRVVSGGGVREVYRSSRVLLYHGDARDLPKVLERESVGLLLTDPPYGVEWRSGSRKESFAKMVGDDGTLDVPAVLGEFVPALRNHRHVYVFGFRPEQVKDPLRLGGTCEIVWDKTTLGLGDLQLPWGPGHEIVAFGVVTGSAVGRDRGDGRLSARMRRGSVVRVQRKNASAVKRHSTEKPVGLLTQFIESSTLLGDLVLDPFAGSMSTGVAAIATGRRAVLCEIDEQHIVPGVERLKAAEKWADGLAGL